MTVKAGSLRHALDRVVPVAARSAKKSPFHCVLIDGDGDRLRLAATDKTRLASAELATVGSIAPIRALVAATALSVPDSIDDDDMVTFEVVEGALELRGRAGAASMPLVDGQFPDLEPFLASDPTARTAVVDRLALLDAIEGLDDAAAVTFQLRSGAIEIGPDPAVVAADYDGAELAIAMNPAFVHQAVSALDGTTIVLEATDPLRPVVLRSTTDDGYTAVVMPVRVA